MLWTTFVVAGAVVVSPLLELDDWFATTQTKEKKARTLLEKSAASIIIKFPSPGRVKTNRYVTTNIYIWSFCLCVLPPLFHKHSGCYGNGLIDVAERNKILKCFWQHRWRVTPNSCNLVVMGLQLSFVFFCKRATAKLKRFLKEYIYSRNFDCFVVDLSYLHLTFVTFCVLSVIRKQ